MAVLATAVWRVRPSGSNTNGGGYDPGIAGAATDYSQQNGAQASGVNGSASGTTTFTATGFTSAMIGNATYITGGGLTTGFYFVTGFTSSTQVTLDRTPGTGSSATWNLGGGWADFWTNCASTGSPLVPLNKVYILGSGTPNPASYTYDYTIATSSKTIIAGSTTTGSITFENDPQTPGYLSPPQTTGGMPTVLCNVSGASSLLGGAQTNFNGIWFVVGSTFQSGSINLAIVKYLGCVFDQNAKDVIIFYGVQADLRGCEVFSYATGAAGTYAVIFTGPITAYNCNFHDLTVGVSYEAVVKFYNCIIAKNKKSTNGLGAINCTSGGTGIIVVNCTIDGNLSSGIHIGFAGGINSATIFNNIISNHTQASTYGINFNTGSAAVNSSICPFFDYNVFYNNLANLNNANNGPHDTTGSSNPYVGQSTENYTLA